MAVFTYTHMNINNRLYIVTFFLILGAILFIFLSFALISPVTKKHNEINIKTILEEELNIDLPVSEHMNLSVLDLYNNGIETYIASLIFPDNLSYLCAITEKEFLWVKEFRAISPVAISDIFGDKNNYLVFVREEEIEAQQENIGEKNILLTILDSSGIEIGNKSIISPDLPQIYFKPLLLDFANDGISEIVLACEKVLLVIDPNDLSILHTIDLGLDEEDKILSLAVYNNIESANEEEIGENNNTTNTDNTAADAKTETCLSETEKKESAAASSGDKKDSDVKTCKIIVGTFQGRLIVVNTTGEIQTKNTGIRYKELIIKQPNFNIWRNSILWHLDRYIIGCTINGNPVFGNDYYIELSKDSKGIVSGIALGDTDGDNITEIAVAASDGWGYIFDIKGRIAANWPQKISYPTPIYSDPLIGSIIFSFLNSVRIYNFDGYMEDEFRADGTITSTPILKKNGMLIVYTDEGKIFFWERGKESIEQEEYTSAEEKKEEVISEEEIEEEQVLEEEYTDEDIAEEEEANWDNYTNWQDDEYTDGERDEDKEDTEYPIEEYSEDEQGSYTEGDEELDEGEFEEEYGEEEAGEEETDEIAEETAEETQKSEKENGLKETEKTEVKERFKDEPIPEESGKEAEEKEIIIEESPEEYEYSDYPEENYIKDTHSTSLNNYTAKQTPLKKKGAPTIGKSSIKTKKEESVITAIKPASAEERLVKYIQGKVNKLFITIKELLKNKISLKTRAASLF